MEAARGSGRGRGRGRRISADPHSSIGAHPATGEPSDDTGAQVHHVSARRHSSGRGGKGGGKGDGKEGSKGGAKGGAKGRGAGRARASQHNPTISPMTCAPCDTSQAPSRAAVAVRAIEPGKDGRAERAGASQEPEERVSRAEEGVSRAVTGAVSGERCAVGGRVKHLPESEVPWQGYAWLRLGGLSLTLEADAEATPAAELAEKELAENLAIQKEERLALEAVYPGEKRMAHHVSPTTPIW